MKINIRLYALVLGASVSLCGTQIGQVAAIDRLFALDPSGVKGSYLVILNLLGVAAFGLLGGKLLQQWAPLTIGIRVPLLAATFSLFLFFRGNATAAEYLFCLFMQSFLQGMEHPNQLRWIQTHLPPEKRTEFFSRALSIQQISFLSAPFIGLILLGAFGARWCFLVDALTFLFSSSAWFLNRFHSEELNQARSSPFDFFDGYRVIFKNPDLRSLSLFRMLNHFAYTTFTVSLPLWIGSLQLGSSQAAATLQATSQGLLALGTVGISVLGGALPLMRHNRVVAHFPFLSSVFGVFAICLLSLHLGMNSIYVGSFVLGVGQYFFRLTGNVIGMAVTPKEMLAPVIVAGDSLTRGFSWAIGPSIPWIYAQSLLFPWILVFSSFAFLAPFAARTAVRTFRLRNE